MIPLVAQISIRAEGRRRFRLWIPLFLVWLLLLPVALIVLPVMAVASLVTGLNPLRVAAALLALICAAAGTCVEVHAPGTDVLVRIA